MADLHETDDAYVVEAELPGIKREDIDVEVSERELVVSQGSTRSASVKASCAAAPGAPGVSIPGAAAGGPQG